LRHQQPERDRPQQGDPEPEQEVEGKVEEVEHRLGEQHRQAEAQYQTGDDEERTPAGGGGRATSDHHRNHRNDARRDPRDEPAEERDDDELTHRLLLVLFAPATSGPSRPPS
jgi:hypothetical protein